MLIATVGLAAPAAAQDCDREDLVYESDPDNPRRSGEYRPQSFRFDGLDLVLTVDGAPRRFLFSGSAGTGIPISLYLPDDNIGGELLSARRWDLSRIAQPGEPDHVIVFADALYWPRCGSR